MVSLALLVGSSVNCMSHGTELQLRLCTCPTSSSAACQPGLSCLCAVALAEIGCMFGSGKVWLLALCASVVLVLSFAFFHISGNWGCYTCLWVSLSS